MLESDPATTWRGLSGPFTCTECGAHIIFDSGGPQQTCDGKRKLCRDCVRARLDAIWDSRPSGVYAFYMRGGAAGEILETFYVRHVNRNDSGGVTKL